MGLIKIIRGWGKPTIVSETRLGEETDEQGRRIARYRIEYSDGTTGMGHRRIVEEPVWDICPDCGGTVMRIDGQEALDTMGTTMMFRCSDCGREEAGGFGVHGTRDEEEPLVIDEMPDAES